MKLVSSNSNSLWNFPTLLPLCWYVRYWLPFQSLPHSQSNHSDILIISFIIICFPAKGAPKAFYSIWNGSQIPSWHRPQALTAPPPTLLLVILIFRIIFLSLLATAAQYRSICHCYNEIHDIGYLKKTRHSCRLQFGNMNAHLALDLLWWAFPWLYHFMADSGKPEALEGARL